VGDKPHWVEPFEGERYSIVYYHWKWFWFKTLLLYYSIY
jgi:hypothetical protein